MLSHVSMPLSGENLGRENRTNAEDQNIGFIRLDGYEVIRNDFELMTINPEFQCQ